MRYPPEIQSLAIVLRGKFNPAIFSPAWFAKVGIITDDELERATTSVIHPELAQFSFEQVRVEVFTNRFQITSFAEPFLRILEVVLGVFRDRLPHTPMDKLGINYEVHFNVGSFDRRVALGRALAPIGPWGEFGKRLLGSTQETTGGLASLAMQENGMSDRQRGWRRVQLEPSTVLRTPSAVKIYVNDHYEVPDAKDEDGTKEVTNILTERFEPSLAQSKAVVSEMMDFASTL